MRSRKGKFQQSGTLKSLYLLLFKSTANSFNKIIKLAGLNCGVVINNIKLYLLQNLDVLHSYLVGP